MPPQLQAVAPAAASGWRRPGRAPLASAAAIPSVFKHQLRSPLVSIGIPAYCRPALLRQTLASLAAQSGFDDFEVIVCDDLGLPATRREVEACALPRIQLYTNARRLGAVANWNRCLQLATGRWMMILHEDDTLYPWYFSTVVHRLRASLSAIAMKCVSGSTPPALPRPEPDSRLPARRYEPAYFLKGGLSPFPGVLFPRELGLRLGGFDERLGPVADYDFWYRLACAGEAEVLPQTGAFYRVSDDQWTTEVWPEMLRKMHLLRLRIAREQFPRHQRFGRWVARFFTHRNALSYARRFGDGSEDLKRGLRLRHIPLRRLPSGWVWRALQRAGRRPRASLST